MAISEKIRERCERGSSKLCKIWLIITRDPKTPEGDPCVRFPGHLIRKPDPCIYSQFLLMQLDQPVTWNNPDVRILQGGVEQNSYNLTAGTEYTIEVTAHNSSRDKPANGTTVYVRWVEFGAGGQTRHLINTLTADVPIWPGTKIVTAQWRTPETPGHYCIEVELAHPNDGNPANNRGWNNTQVHAANSPVTRPIRVFNRHTGPCPSVKEGGGPNLRPERVIFGWSILGALAGAYLYHYWPDTWGTVARVATGAGMGYFLLAVVGFVSEATYAWIKRQRNEREGKKPYKPDRIDCHRVEIDVDSYEFKDDVGKTFEPDEAFKGKAPIWSARVEPSQFVFADDEVFRDVDLLVDAPDDPGPPGIFNVNVRQGGEPTGGVTVQITRGGQ